MTDQEFFCGNAQRGDYVVPAPRLADAIGQALKGVYSTSAVPPEMQVLLAKLDQFLH
ncbi:MAG: hypothetical protein M3R64_08745 [Pseudomonadota bacterium]|nr:hypothetical protein [Pseudomonadota bacterium]